MNKCHNTSETIVTIIPSAELELLLLQAESQEHTCSSRAPHSTSSRPGRANSGFLLQESTGAAAHQEKSPSTHRMKTPHEQ